MLVLLMHHIHLIEYINMVDHSVEEFRDIKESKNHHHDFTILLFHPFPLIFNTI
jgi:hypothetical protein